MTNSQVPQYLPHLVTYSHQWALWPRQQRLLPVDSSLIKIQSLSISGRGRLF